MLLLLPLLGCPSDPPKDDTADTVDTSSGALPGPSGAGRQTRSCAPDDGAAVEVIIGLDGAGCDASYSAVPHVRVTMWTAWPLAAGTYPFDSSNSSAFLSVDGVMEDIVSRGELVIAADGTGSYTLDVQGGDTYEGTFTLESCDSTIMCG